MKNSVPGPFHAGSDWRDHSSPYVPSSGRRGETRGQGRELPRAVSTNNAYNRIERSSRQLPPFTDKAASPSGCPERLAQGDERSEELTGATVAFFEVGAAEPRDETGVAIPVGNV